ncbi:hypothetical protein J8273_5284 [Carpediemonas membranifera]|uniref:Uncharacterized protein n=1 Tax=Carpediemonas membranifera TaxID=201153 RepID=A0A8J6AV19_9EUKA|nr:hypothetical protein J8273_5284 [Carpediemonas membranifera]|eukprot:KAG9392295.1 hypothetical protein J8273_5284 [Carpediemonas membranifera]
MQTFRVFALVALVACVSCFSAITVATDPSSNPDGQFFPAPLIGTNDMIPIAVANWMQGDYNTKVYIYTSADGKTWSKNEAITGDNYGMLIPMVISRDYLMLAATNMETGEAAVFDYKRSGHKALIPNGKLPANGYASAAVFKEDAVLSIDSTGQLSGAFRVNGKLQAAKTVSIEVDNEPIAMKLVDDDMLLIDTNGTAIVAVSDSHGGYTKTQTISVPPEFVLPDSENCAGFGAVVYQKISEDMTAAPSFVIFERDGNQLKHFKLDLTDAMLEPVASMGIVSKGIVQATPVVLSAHTIEVSLTCLTTKNTWAVTRLVLATSPSGWVVQRVNGVGMSGSQIMMTGVSLSSGAVYVLGGSADMSQSVLSLAQ